MQPPKTGPKAAITVFSGLMAAALAISACSSTSGNKSAPDTSSANGAATARLAFGSSPWDQGLNARVGAIVNGAKFNLHMTNQDIKAFNSHALAMQVLLSGKTDAVSTGFISALQLVERGVPIKVFCLSAKGFNSKLVGVGDVTTLNDITKPNVRNAIESPGGPTNFLEDLALKGKGLDITTATLKNTVILDDSDQRASALAAGQVDVAALDTVLVPRVEEALGKGKVHVLMDIMEAIGPSGGIYTAFTAKSSWLDEHPDIAASMCAATIATSRQMMSDFDFFKKIADQEIKPNVAEADLKVDWEAMQKNPAWPLEKSQDTLTHKDQVDSIIQIALDQKLITEKIAYDQIIDRNVLDKAWDMVGAETDKS